MVVLKRCALLFPFLLLRLWWTLTCRVFQDHRELRPHTISGGATAVLQKFDLASRWREAGDCSLRHLTVITTCRRLTSYEEFPFVQELS